MTPKVLSCCAGSVPVGDEDNIAQTGRLVTIHTDSFYCTFNWTEIIGRRSSLSQIRHSSFPRHLPRRVNVVTLHYNSESSKFFHITSAKYSKKTQISIYTYRERAGGDTSYPTSYLFYVSNLFYVLQ